MTSIDLHPEFLTKDGQREFAILPYSEFVALQEWLEDVEDLLDLREARKDDAGASNVSLDQVEKEFGIY